MNDIILKHALAAYIAQAGIPANQTLPFVVKAKTIPGSLVPVFAALLDYVGVRNISLVGAYADEQADLFAKCGWVTSETTIRQTGERIITMANQLSDADRALADDYYRFFLTENADVTVQQLEDWRYAQISDAWIPVARSEDLIAKRIAEKENAIGRRLNATELEAMYMDGGAL